jgi:2-hydroxy-4-carboxymuconate semialdehyde hemiacetal dehydrogenase
MKAGKHCRSKSAGRQLGRCAGGAAEVQAETGKTCMVGHTRRFNPSHQWVHNRSRRANWRSSRWMCRPISSAAPTSTPRASRAAGPTTCCGTTPRTRWTCSPIRRAGSWPPTPSRADPPHAGHRDGHVDPAQERDGAICTLSLSFNNDGPLGTFFRYIGDKGTYIARYDDLVDGRENAIDVSQVDVSMNGIELQDREFIAAIREGREPNSSVQKVFDCYRVLGELEVQLNAGK